MKQNSMVGVQIGYWELAAVRKDASMLMVECQTENLAVSASWQQPIKVDILDRLGAYCADSWTLIRRTTIERNIGCRPSDEP